MVNPYPAVSLDSMSATGTDDVIPEGLIIGAAAEIRHVRETYGAGFRTKLGERTECWSGMWQEVLALAEQQQLLPR